MTANFPQADNEPPRGGDAVEKLVELAVRFRRRVEGEDLVALESRIEGIFKKCPDDYPSVRERLLRWIRETESAEEIDCCLNFLGNFRDYGAIEECRKFEVKVDPSHYHINFSEYVGEHLSAVVYPDVETILTDQDLAKARVKVVGLSGASLAFYRQPSHVLSPLFPATRRIGLNGGAWMTGYDPVANRYILTLREDNRVLGINAHTLETEMELVSPKKSLRGLAVHAGLRRGFFNAEFASVMISFDLDSFEIRQEITGFSFRPERIYLDTATNTAVTGNLGLPAVSANGVHYSLFKAMPRTDGNSRQSQTMNLIDTDKEEVVRTLPTGRRPTAVDISTKYIAAGNFFDNSVTVYERQNLDNCKTISLDMINDLSVDFEIPDKFKGVNLKISKILRARVVEGIALLDKRGWVLVSGFDACIVTIVDIAKGEVIGMIPVQDRPFDVVADKEEKYAFVPCYGSAQVSVVDLDRREEVCRLQTGPKPQDLTLVGDTLLVADETGVSIHDLGKLNLASL